MRRTMQGATAAERLAVRWFPKDATIVDHPDGADFGVAAIAEYTKNTVKQCWQVIGYRKTAGKPEFNNLYSVKEQAEEKIQNFFKSINQHSEFVADRRKARNAPHSFNVGDIIYNSWGYDQTNIDFYEVVRKTPHFVFIRELQGKSGEGTGPFSGTISACPGMYASDKIEQHAATGTYVTMRHGCGSKWDGQPKHNSWGH